MSRLSPVEIAAVVVAAGFPDPVTAVAVVLGESGGDTRAVNRNTDGSIDRGLWQINSRWHPDVTDEQAFDINASTQAAWRISSGGTDFNPWHATKATAFAGHLETARDALDRLNVSDELRDRAETAEGDPGVRTVSPVDVVRSGAGTVADVASGALGGIGELVGLAARALGVLTSGDFWRRAALVVAGVALLVLAAVLVFGRSAVRNVSPLAR